MSISRGRRLDAKLGNRATEVERSGSPARLRQAARRLKTSGAGQRVLQVPQQDFAKAADAMKQESVTGTVKNMTGTKRRSIGR